MSEILQQTKIMRVLAYSPKLLDDIIADIKDPAEQNTARQIISGFAQAGLPIKVKHVFYDKPDAYYRVLCHVRKSREALILNTKTDHGKQGVAGGMTLQLRIENQSTFDQLDNFSEHVRSQILNGNDCHHCSTACKKHYVFAHQGKQHQKCQYLCSNFRFANITKDDAASLMEIVNGEITRT